jgi:hypothetical protein
MTLNSSLYTVMVQMNCIQDNIMRDRLNEMRRGDDLFCDRDRLLVVHNSDVIFVYRFNEVSDIVSRYVKEFGVCYLDHDFNLMRKPSGRITKIIRFIKCMYNRSYYNPY